jgi:DNA invertase Pin-like site-specific DNA recombinase
MSINSTGALTLQRMGLQRGVLHQQRPDRGEADVLVASRCDRAARSASDFCALLDRAEKRGWRVCVLDVDVATTTAAGRLVVDVVAAAAQIESKRIGERVRDAHAVRKAQGSVPVRHRSCPTTSASGSTRITSQVCPSPRSPVTSTARACPRPGEGRGGP